MRYYPRNRGAGRRELRWMGWLCLCDNADFIVVVERDHLFKMAHIKDQGSPTVRHLVLVRVTGRAAKLTRVYRKWLN